MNTEKERLLNSLIEGICSRNQSHTNEFILAEYIANVVFRKPAIWEQKDTPIDYANVILRKDEDYTLLTERCQSLMQDFQGKCDELATTQVEVTDLRSAHCMLQEQFNSVERAIKGMRGDYNELKNSKAALQRDYDAIAAGLVLRNDNYTALQAELYSLTQEANSLREANATGTEILATTRDELSYIKHEQKTLQTAAESYLKVIYAALKAIGVPEGANIYTLEDEVIELKAANIALLDRYNYVTKSNIEGLDDDKSRELIMTLRDIGVHLGAHSENANTIAAWVKQNVPAGDTKTPRSKRSLKSDPKFDEVIGVNPQLDDDSIVRPYNYIGEEP